MGDSLKLSKDKRHRSSSSITGAGIEGTRSERKLDIRGLIPEVGDYFAVAESRCDDLQEKIDLLKVLKRKKKLNKRSMTRVAEGPTASENPVPFISVRTQPKKRVLVSEVAGPARPRRMEVALHPARGYIDPATVEQHRMLGQVWARPRAGAQNEYPAEPKQYQSLRPRRNRADGDGMCGQSIQAGFDDGATFQERQGFHQNINDIFLQQEHGRKSPKRETTSGSTDRVKPGTPGAPQSGKGMQVTPAARRPKPTYKQQQDQMQQLQHQQVQQIYQQQQTSPKPEERPVVELFNKSRSSNSPPAQVSPHARPPSRPHSRLDDRFQNRPLNTHGVVAPSDVLIGQSAVSAESVKKSRRKLRNRSYELPTVASQLKQAEARQSRCGAVTNSSYIPFIVSKNAGPSYNIGVNVQQVLNGMKIQQPLKGIPLTIAHHMGLGHIPTYRTKRMSKIEKPMLNKVAMNAITMGARTLTLPSRRSISYNRLLSMYSCGDGMVPRFLRANARASDFLYNSLYETREEAEGSAASEPQGSEPSAHSDQVKRAEQAERAERAERASATKSARARRYKRYMQLTQLYNECQKLEQVHKGGAGNKETVRRYNEILRILRANKDNMSQQGQQRCTMPRKTSTNTTLVSSGTDAIERELNQSDQVEDRGRGNRTVSGGASKASVHDGRIPHYSVLLGDRVDPRKSTTQGFR